MKYKILQALVMGTLIMGVTTVEAAHISVSKESETVTTVKDNHVVKSGSVDIHKNIRQQLVNQDTMPILLRTFYGQTSSTGELAIIEGKHIYIPLDVYKQVNFNPISSEKGQSYVQLPAPRRAGNMLYAGDPRQGQRHIQMATTMRNGRLYVDMSSTSPALGVMAVKTKQGLELSAPLGSMELESRREIQEPLAWVFDPLVTAAYEGAVAPNSTSIVSPTWFDISEKGVSIKPKVQLDYVNTYKDQKYRVWPLVTNTFNADFTSKILDNEKSWILIGDDLVLYALMYGYDGYNFDFENIHYKDKNRLTKFVTYLAQRLHEVNLFVSMDVTGYSDSENWSLVYDRKQLSKSLDYVVLMAYDETAAGSQKAGPVASYPWVKHNAMTMIKEIAPEKLILGIPYYMRIWEKTISVDAKGQVHYGLAKSRTLPMDEANELKATYGDRITWDDDLKVNYLRFGKDELGEMLLAYAETGREPRITGGLRNKKATILEVWFEDEASMAYKLNVIPELKLAGFAAWRKGFETPAFRQYMTKEFDAHNVKKLEKSKHKKRIAPNAPIVSITKEDTEITETKEPLLLRKQREEL